MLLIACPYCGPRAEIEFDWGGPSHVERPAPPDAVSAPEWGAYLYFRDNLKGPAAERWRHTHGCAQWFNLVRDTATHQILAVYRLDEPPPMPGGRS